MLVIQMLLPRFLVLEGLLLFHFLHKTTACNKLLGRQDSSQSKAIQNFCSFDLSGWNVQNPPLFRSASSGDFILPSSDQKSNQRRRWIHFPAEQFVVECPGAKLRSWGNKKSAKLKCHEDQVHVETEEGDLVALNDLSCSRSIREEVEQGHVDCGPQAGDGKIVHIGWRLSDGRFKSQITVCHDDETSNTYFSNHTIEGNNIDARDTKSERPSYFKEGHYYDGFSASKAYKLRNQKVNLETIFGHSKAAEIFQSKKHYLTKGHLAPDADFLFQEWQDATYHFINVAPQWQTFNNGNWRAVESAVRNYASQIRNAIQVYTGTLGVLKYKNGHGIPTPVFLAKDEARSNNQLDNVFSLLPTPEYFWKLAYNPTLDQAIVFIGLNDPHFKGNPELTAQICPDICAKSKWFFLYQKKVEKGYTFCCKYQDFKAIIDWIPDLPDPGIMENIIPLA